MKGRDKLVKLIVEEMKVGEGRVVAETVVVWLGQWCYAIYTIRSRNPIQ
jgi:hypothetical protein